jgi:2-(1,2-epoxy-1,2-dihydrophenyl)acetyl-CoA isomerase
VSEALVELRVADSIAQIVLARAEARNAIDPAWVDALAAAVDTCAVAEGVRAVLITADGPAFSVGGDLNHFAAHVDELPVQLDQMIGKFHATLHTLADLPVPVVCAAHGAVAGGGIGLLWASDFVLLADDVKFATGFGRLGLSGDGGSSWYLPRLVGLRRATQLIMEGRGLNAAEMVEWNLADRVFTRAELPGEALALARALAAGPTHAFGEMRRLIRGALEIDLQAGLAAEHAAVVRCGATADAREGVVSFTERRPPEFTGR